VVRDTVLVLREHDALWSAEALPEVLAAAETLHHGLARAGYTVVPLQLATPQQLRALLKPYSPCECVVFNWYEGAQWGADDLAQVTATLDTLGYLYTGSGTTTLLMTQDKTRTKQVLNASGIPTPAWRPVLGDGWVKWDCYPAIVQVANEHGSEGLTACSVVHNKRALRARIAELSALHQRLMVAEFIDGREFCVSVWGNGELEVLPLVEIDFSALPHTTPRVRTFESKWDSTSTDYQRIKTICAPRLPRTLQRRIEQVACDTYRAFELRDYARIDVRLQGETPQVIDVNPNPDIVAESSFVSSAAQAGYDYAAMLDRIVRHAVQRAETHAHWTSHHHHHYHLGA
jgi:D-alanine-D-alanine ligase